MNPADWAGIAVSATTLIGVMAIGVRHLVKYYLSELRPNSGSSLKDQVGRLEEKVELLTDLVKQVITK
jgi:hypothetical protein